MTRLRCHRIFRCCRVGNHRVPARILSTTNCMLPACTTYGSFSHHSAVLTLSCPSYKTCGHTISALKNATADTQQHMDGACHDCQVMQAWDINTATLKAKYHFKWMNKQVEGFAFVPVKEGTQSSTRQVYMVVDTPPTLYLVDIPIP